MDRPPSKHTALILDQFTKQSETFASAPALSESNAMELLEKACQVSKQDIVLDVACGAGIVTCYLARLAYHVTGIDVTPAMIERCRDRQSKENLANLSWHVGDVLPLPMADASFTLWNRDPQGTPLFAMKCFGCFISLHPLAVQEHSLNDLGLA